MQTPPKFLDKIHEEVNSHQMCFPVHEAYDLRQLRSTSIYSGCRTVKHIRFSCYTRERMDCLLIEGHRKTTEDTRRTNSNGNFHIKMHARVHGRKMHNIKIYVTHFKKENNKFRNSWILKVWKRRMTKRPTHADLEMVYFIIFWGEFVTENSTLHIPF